MPSRAPVRRAAGAGRPGSPSGSDRSRRRRAGARLLRSLTHPRAAPAVRAPMRVAERYRRGGAAPGPPPRGPPSPPLPPPPAPDAGCRAVSAGGAASATTARGASVLANSPVTGFFGGGGGGGLGDGRAVPRAPGSRLGGLDTSTVGESDASAEAGGAGFACVASRGGQQAAASE